MTYLVDANVLSEPTKPDPHPGVVEWLRRHERELVVDPIILGELRFGILLLPKGKRRRRLERWFDAGVERLLRESLAAEARRAADAKDLDAINRQADALNAEVEDVLSYQVDV